MNPEANPLIKHFIFRRDTEAFPDWAIAAPVLFACMVLFLVASFRRGGGGGGLVWALGFLVAACGGLMVPSQGSLLGVLSEVGQGRVWQPLMLLVGGAAFAGYLMFLGRELVGIKGYGVGALALAPALFAAYIGYALRTWDVPLHIKLAPIFALLLVHVFWVSIRNGLIVGCVLVVVLSAMYLPLAVMFKPVFSWWVVLVPMVAGALVYVGLMYVKDAQSIHPLWAAFLGLLRCTVYAILAFVFLLPGCQSVDQTKYYPKVLVLFDVSGSMKTKDDLLEPGQKPETLLTRQDKVIDFWAGTMGPDKKPRRSFQERLVEKSPVHGVRFGSIADETTIAKLTEGNLWSVSDYKIWLNPDKKDVVVPSDVKPEDQAKVRARMLDTIDSLVSGTNVGGSALQIAKAESASYLQAILIISDGQSNQGSSESMREFLARVNNPKRKVPVLTVGVGAYRQPANIRIDDLQTAQVARPDDKFPVRVPVIGSASLRDEEFDVTVDVVRTKDGLGNPLKGEKKFTLPSKRGKFKGGGDHPQDLVEFEVDLQQLKGVKASDDKNRELEGEWEIVARVPRNPRESFADPEHVTDPPTRVQVQNKELRVLLFAGGPTREYQFLRTLLFREVQEKRVELSVFLQTGGNEKDVDQDVAHERLLAHFPNRLGLDDPTDKYSSLNMYDVVIAVDPDWTALDANQIKLVEQWVGRDAGGIIFIAEPVHTFALSRSSETLLPVKNLLPVVLKDFRLTGFGLGVDTTRPYLLRFSKASQGFDFLKLDESPDAAGGGWDKFFWGEEGKPAAGNDPRPARGIYNYYPVENIRPDSTVLATFVGPELTKINDGKDEQPYLVTMRYGNGKSIYIGSGETWRLRQFKQTFHERLWIKMARFAASGSTQQKKYGSFLMSRKAPAGSINVEARIKGADLMPLPRDSKPIVQVRKRGEQEKKPESFELRAKSTQGDWHGWFTGAFKVKDAGEYELTIAIPNTTETLSHVIEVFKPNLEEANVRENHKELYQLASNASDVLNRLPAGETRKEVERLLQPVSDDIRDGKEGARLFFPLSAADVIPKLLIKLEPRTEETKGALEDLWDEGTSDYQLLARHFLWAVPMALGLLACFVLLFHQKFVWAAVALIGAVTVPLLVVGVEWLLPSALKPEWLTQDYIVKMDFSFLAAAVVTLLAVEWLTRKLLKLA